MTERIKIERSSGNVFRDIGFRPARAHNLLLRSEMMTRIEQFVKRSDLTQKDAARLLGITQPRLNDLLKGRIVVINAFFTSCKDTCPIMAHSMGCLIARYYIERLGGKRRVERVVLLGGPHRGNPYAFATLLSGPKLLPLGMKNVQWRERLATFPSWYQILPTDDSVRDGDAPLDLLGDDSWVPEPQRPLLHDAHRFRQELGTHSSVPAVCIFGYGFKTIVGATVARAADGDVRDAEFDYTDAGDGMIPQHSAILPGAEIHPVRQQHGSLYVDDDVRMRLQLELTRAVL